MQICICRISVKIKIGDITKIRTGKLDANAADENGQYPFFTCSKEPLKINTYSYDCECVLVAGNGDLNVKYYNGKFDAYQRTYIIEDDSDGLLFMPYLYFFMESYIDELRKQSIGGVIKYIKLKNLTDALIELPSIEVQRKIVNIISKAKEIVRRKENEFELLDELVKARFVEMFGDENNSKGWEIVNIEDVVNVQVGVVIKPSQYYTNQYNGIKAFRSLNIGNGYIKDDDWVYFSKEGNKKNKKSILSTNDVLVVRSGAPGTACVVTSEYAGSNAIDVIIAHPDFQKVDSHYLCTYTNMPHGKSQIIEGTGGAAQQHFNVGKYNKLKLMLPPLEYQKQYVKFFEEIDKSRLLNICLKSLVESVLKIRIFSEYKKSS